MKPVRCNSNSPGVLVWMYIACLPHREHRGIKGGECVGTTRRKKVPPPSPPRRRWGKPRGSTYTWVVTSLIAIVLLLVPVRLQAAVVLDSGEYGQALFIKGERKVYPNGRDEAMYGLRLDLKGKWLTYWQYPGDAGLPLKAELSNLSNASLKADVYFPTPMRIVEDFGLEAVGYHGHVIFPIKINTENAGVASGDISFQFMVCSDICIPKKLSARFESRRDEITDPGEKAVIENAMAIVPGESGTATIYDVQVMDKNKILKVLVETGRAFNNPDIIITPPVGLRFPKPEVILSDDKLLALFTYNYEIAGLQKTFQESDLSFLLVDGKHSQFLKRSEGKAGNNQVMEAEIAKMLKRPVEEPVRNTPLNSPPPQPKEYPIIAYMIFAFVGGFILNFMPCVLPVLSIKVLSLVKFAGLERAKARKSFLWSAFGIISAFMAMAVLLVTLKSLGEAVGWGLQFQQPGFIIFLIVVLTLFTANMWGFFEIWLPQALGGSIEKMIEGGRGGNLGAFLTGIFAMILATPCTAPFLGVAVSFAISSNPLVILTIFFCMGLGLAYPYLVVAAFPQIATMLPRPGAWMEKFKHLLGYLLLITVGWLIWVLSMQVSVNLAVTVLIMSCGSLALFGLPQAHKIRLLHILPLAAFFAVMLVVIFSKPSDNGEWQDFSQSKLERYINNGQTVFVDVTADWCLTCKANKALVLNTPEIKKLFRDEGVVLLRADYTNHDDNIRQFLESHNRYGIPFNVLYKSGGKHIYRELLTKDEVLDSLQ